MPFPRCEKYIPKPLGALFVIKNIKYVISRVGKLAWTSRCDVMEVTSETNVLGASFFHRRVFCRGAKGEWKPYNVCQCVVACI